MIRRRAPTPMDRSAWSDDIVQIFPPKTLRERVGPGAGLNPKLLADAEATVSALQTAYEQRIDNDISALTTSFDAMRRSGRYDHDQLYLIAHEIKGEGGSYDYPLLSAFGHALCILVRSRDRLRPRMSTRSRRISRRCAPSFGAGCVAKAEPSAASLPRI